MKRRQFLAAVAHVLAWLGVGGCGELSQGTTWTPMPPDQEDITLLDPRKEGSLSLEAVLKMRRSVRAYSGEPLSQEELAQLLWAAQGVTASWGGRTAPSAGALYPLEVYAATPAGCYHYETGEHKLSLQAAGDLRQALWQAGVKQDWIREAAAVIVLAAVYGRTAEKYGERAERYVLLEAGHAAQNVLLQAAALGLGAVPVGAFYDDQVREAMALPEDQSPLCIIPVGHPQ